MRIHNHSVKVSKNVEAKYDEFQSENSKRVNINNLMSKVRADHKRKKKENLVFVGLLGSIVVITGIIASL